MARRLAALLIVFCLAGIPALAGVWASSAAKMSCARTGKGNCCCKKQSSVDGFSLRAQRCAEKCCQTPASPQSISDLTATMHVLAEYVPLGSAAPLAGTAFASAATYLELHQRPPPVFHL